MSSSEGRRVFVSLVAGAVFCLGAAGIANQRLLAMRDRYGIDSGAPLENAPPLMVFTTVVLGGLRGVLADMLWLRVSYLQDQGQYVELVQLSDWITKLEPRCSEIWGFHAWNLAYNVSVMFGSPEDRWRWVEHGIELLKDEGLHYNPGSAKLCWELGWLYQHKVGAPLDSAHPYYKRKLANAVSRVLPDGRLPSALSEDSVKYCKEVLKMDPPFIREIDRKHGPLDWRLPESHAVYWAERGRLTADAQELVACDRMVFQSMAVLFKRGKLEYNLAAGTYVRQPDVNLLAKAIGAYERAMKKHPQQQSIRTAYANFLKHAVLLLDGRGRQKEARAAFELLHLQFPSTETIAGYEPFVSGK